MLRLASEGESPTQADTDFEFLGDSEATPAGELRTVLHPRHPAGAAGSVRPALASVRIDWTAIFMRLLNKVNEVLWRFVLPICGVAVGATAMVTYIGSEELVLAIVWGTVVALSVLILWLANRAKARKQWREADGVVDEEPGPRHNGE